jgi:multiple sugar transport system permease protein
MFKTISGRNRIKKIGILISSFIVLFYLLGPIFWVVNSSFQKESAFYDRPPNFITRPEIFTTNHYYFLFTGIVPPDSTVMLQSMYTMSGTLVYPSIINSLLIAIIVAVINILLGFPASHVFARYRFWGDNHSLLFLLATRLLPSISIVIPIYMIFLRFDWIDTKRGLIMLYVAMTLPFTIWILRAYFKNIPVEFEEAARMDGCGYFGMLLKVAMPLARPGIIAASIFAFMSAYGEFVFATILTQTINARTQTAVLAALSQGMSSSRGMIAAAATLAIIPPIIIALSFRKQILDGLTGRFRF